MYTQVMSQGQLTIPLVKEQVSLAFQRSILALPFEYVISVVCFASCWMDRIALKFSSTIDTHTAPSIAGPCMQSSDHTPLSPSPQPPLIKVCLDRSHCVCGQTGLWSSC